jgi:hypothetical protein
MSSLRRSLTGLELRKLHVQSLRADVYPTTAKFRPHPGQSVKTGSSLTAMRHLFPEMSDECLLYICLRRPYRRSGLYRSVMGSCGSRVVRVCDNRPVLGCWWLRPLSARKRWRSPSRWPLGPGGFASLVVLICPVSEARSLPDPRCLVSVPNRVLAANPVSTGNNAVPSKCWPTPRAVSTRKCSS